MTAKDKEAFLQSKLFSKINMDFFKDKMEIVSVKKGETVWLKKTSAAVLHLSLRETPLLQKSVFMEEEPL